MCSLRSLAKDDIKLQGQHLICLSPLCCYVCELKSLIFGNISYKKRICNAFPNVCVLKCLLKWPQIACLRRRKVTRLAFIWLLSTVYFQMCSQNVCSERCIITLGAFISWKSFISQDSVYQRHNILFCHHSPCCKGNLCPKFEFKRSKTAKWIREFGGRFIRAHSNHSPMMT